MIYKSELKILELLWIEGELTAKELAEKLNASIAWSKTTTYTIIKRCLTKGYIERLGTNFTCRAIITREEARQQELSILSEKMFDGSKDQLLASLLGRSSITPTQIKQLRQLVQVFTNE